MSYRSTQTHNDVRKKLGTGDTVGIQGADDFFSQLDVITNLSREERTDIVEAGAPIVEAHLKQDIPTRIHEYPSQDTLFGYKIGHIRDAITHKPGQYLDGGTDIGFTAKIAPIARWVNWGTYRQDAQFFMEKSFAELDTNSVFDAQANKAKQILKDKGVKID